MSFSPSLLASLRLLFALFLFGLHHASAQTTPPLPRTDSALVVSQPAQTQAAQAFAQAQVLAATDTVAALHRMFAAKRQRGHFVAGGLVLATALGIAFTRETTDPMRYGQYYMSIQAAATVVLVVIPVLTASLVYHAQYNRLRERQAVDAFATHRLPHAIKSRLREQYFRLPAYPAQPAPTGRTGPR